MSLCAALCSFEGSAVPLKPAYPRWSSTIPVQFRGSWDEQIGDGCTDREARYALEANGLHEFEVWWHVRRVKLVGKESIAIDAVLDKQFGQPEHFTWRFKLVPGGIKHPDGDGTVFRRCPHPFSFGK